MMPYKSLYIRLFPFFMKKYMKEQYGAYITKMAFRNAPSIYRDMLWKVDDIGADNPMAGNIYMAFVFMAIWKAADGKIDIKSYRTVVRNTVTKSFMRKFIGKNDLNSPDGVKIGNEKMHRMKEWADSHPQYTGKTWDITFDDSLHRDGFFYYFTQCPINTFARKYGYLEVLPVCCELDHILTEASHGKLIRKYTLATDGNMCDYWIVPDRIKEPK